MADNETTTDIIAEMRRGTRLPGYWRSCDVNEILQYHADRLDAAHKRECGNAAKLREAVKAVVDVGYPHNFQVEAPHIRGYCYEITEAIKKCFAALAAPARNCDVLSAQEQTEKFNQFCQSHRNSDLPKCAGCPLEDIPDGTGCSQAWAQMPYEEKEG